MFEKELKKYVSNLDENFYQVFRDVSKLNRMRKSEYEG